MVSRGNSSKSPCNTANQTEEEGEEEDVVLNWSGEEVSWVLLAFFIGYALFQVLNRA